MFKFLKKLFTPARLKTGFAVIRVAVTQILPLVFTTPQFALIQQLALEAVTVAEKMVGATSDEKRTSALNTLTASVQSAGVTASKNLLSTAIELAVSKLK